MTRRAKTGGRVQAVFRRLNDLYARMQSEYTTAAGRLGLSCEGCVRNCCTSHFQHHTYVEWAYLWQGMRQLPEKQREEYLRRARENVQACAGALTMGNTPQVMCPLNDEGLCGLYAHRLMICRLHGVPNTMTRPDGRVLVFAGCWRSQELTTDLEAEGRTPSAMDRTPLYTELVVIERAFLGSRFGKLPKVDMTLAQMLTAGPPRISPAR